MNYTTGMFIPCANCGEFIYESNVDLHSKCCNVKIISSFVNTIDCSLFYLGKVNKHIKHQLMNNKSNYIYNVLSLYLDKVINYNANESKYDNMEYYKLLKQTKANLVMLSVTVERNLNFQLVLIVDKVKQLVESILKEVKIHIRKRVSCGRTYTVVAQGDGVNEEKDNNVVMNQLYKEFCVKYYKYKIRFIDISNNSECNVKNLFMKCIANNVPYYKWEQFIMMMFKKYNLLCSNKRVFKGHSSHCLKKLDTIIDEISEE
jgi:hypothetical protein